jgi:dTDP-4-dehydrorhamnose reductase
MNSKTLLITGASGYLGRHLTAKAVKTGQVYAAYGSHPGRVVAGQPVHLNLTDSASVKQVITRLSPQVIIHAAALNPGQGDEAEMVRVNVLGTRYVAEAAAAVRARLVCVSTDIVHDGRNAPYAGDVPPSPINSYGRSKAAAEAAIAEIIPSATIVRTSLIYGLDEIDRGTQGFAERLNEGQPLILFSDVIRQPVWVDTLVEALLRLTLKDEGGGLKAESLQSSAFSPQPFILTVAGRQALTREEFGRRMLAWWGVDPGDLLQPGRAADMSNTIPLDLRLDVSAAEQWLGMTFPGVDEVLTAAKRQR